MRKESPWIFLRCTTDVIARESGPLPAVVFFWHGPIVTMIMESFLDEFIYILNF